MKKPRDKTHYDQDPRSIPIHAGIANGLYVFVQDEMGIIWVLPDEGHLHPKVLGKRKPALYAGDLTLLDGKIKDVTNLSGSFRFASKKGLLLAARQLKIQGLEVLPGAIRFFPKDGRPPLILPGDFE